MCDICVSPLVNDLNRKRNWRPDRVINWAKRRGLNITEEQLAKHFAELATKSNISKPSEDIFADRKNEPQKSISTRESPSITVPDLPDQSDNLFLNEIVKRAFADLLEGKFELKLEHGFKAIEIKQKLTEKNEVEDKLLELLNEIRRQELGNPT